jgi:hypothetical protein
LSPPDKSADELLDLVETSWAVGIKSQHVPNARKYQVIGNCNLATDSQGEILPFLQTLLEISQNGLKLVVRREASSERKPEHCSWSLKLFPKPTQRLCFLWIRFRG